MGTPRGGFGGEMAKIIRRIVVLVGSVFLSSLMAMWGWNWVIARKFELANLGYWEMFVLIWVAQFIFGHYGKKD